LASFVGGSAFTGGWLGTVSNHPLSFFTSNGSASLTISADGKVGIGTTTPPTAYKLQVYGDTQMIGSLAINIGSASYTALRVQAAVEDDRALEVFNTGGSPLFELVPATVTLPNQLRMWGDAFKNSGGTSWGTFSDQRLKKDIRTFEPGLDEIMKLRPVRFRYRDDVKPGLTSDHEEVGFVAQEVRQVMPEAVAEDPDGYLTLKADPIHWAGIHAIQELNAKLEKERAENIRTQSENAELRKRLEKLERWMEQKNGGAR
jgi:hypothetical protein